MSLLRFFPFFFLVFFRFLPFFPCFLSVFFRFFPFFPCFLSVFSLFSFRFFLVFFPFFPCFLSVFFRFLPFSSIFSVFFRFFRFIFRKKRGDTVRETPFAKPEKSGPNQVRGGRVRKGFGSREVGPAGKALWLLRKVLTQRSQKIPMSLQGSTRKMGIFLTQSALVWGTGKWEFFDPQPLFSRFWGFWPV